MSTDQPSAQTLSGAIQAYLRWHTLGTPPSAVAEKSRVLGCSIAGVGDRPITDLSSDACGTYLLAVQDRGRKANTVTAYHRALTAFCRWLCVEQYLAASPMVREPKPKVNQQQIQPLAEEEGDDCWRYPIAPLSWACKTPPLLACWSIAACA